MLSGKLSLKASLSLIFFFFFFQLSFSQPYSGHIWYFGNSSRGIEFNKSDDQPRLTDEQNATFGTGGGAVATHPITGNLLFYTNGQTVYDATHQAMPGGTGLMGNSAGNQAAVVAQDPLDADRYLIFTNSASNGSSGTINYSIVDMTMAGNSGVAGQPLGDLLSINQGGIGNVSQGMAVFSGADANWIVYHDAGANELAVEEIDGGGTLVPADRESIPVPFAASNISFVQLPDGTVRLAVSPESSGANVQLFTFDPATGTLTRDEPVYNSASTVGIYDTEWSADGRYLYISDEEGEVYQYDTQNPGIALTTVLPAGVSGDMTASHGLQMGPDNRIYHIYENSSGAFVLGRINYPDSVANIAGYENAPLTAMGFSGMQFPALLPQGQQQAINGLGFAVVDSCQNNTTKFFPEAVDNEPLPTEYIWDFGDGSTSTEIAPSHEYTVPGPYQVRLTAIRGQDTTEYARTVTILANQDSVDLGQDTVICPGETLPLELGEGVSQGNIASIGWSTGGTGPSIEVDSAGYYWVAVELNNGCRVYDGIQVDVYGEERQRANFWYFGDQAGIDFNDGNAVAVQDGLMTAPEGVATMSDGNGDLLFYTDGNNLWGVDRSNGSHVLIESGLGGGNDATQSSIIIPYPGDETLFYIITAEEGPGDPGSDHTYNLNYSIVDIKGNGGTGEVIVKNKPLFAPSTERMTAAEMNDGVVLLAHELGNNTFRAYFIDSTGINDPVLSSVGSDHNFFPAENAEGYMKFAPDASLVAVALPGDENVVEVFTFVDSTLTLVNPITLTFDEPGYEVYGIEFSPGVNKLYVTMRGATDSKLYEIRLDSLDEEFMMATAQDTTISAELGAIQIAPNQQIYVAVNGSGFLGTIRASEDTVDASTFVLEGFNLQGGTSALGLPNFIQTIFSGQGEPTIEVDGAQCEGSEVEFSAAGTSQIDEFSWTIRRLSDNSLVHSDNGETTSFTFNNAGEYAASVQITNRCGLDTTLIENFVINGSPEPPTIPGAASICEEELVLDADSDNRSGLTYLWSTGETTKTITVTTAGTYSVTLTDENGCTSEGESFVSDNVPEVDLGPDLVVCQNESVPDLQTGISEIAEFTWWINTIDQNREVSFIPVNTSVPNDFEYVVMVEDTFNGCFVYDTVNIQVNPEPAVVFNTDPSTCGNDDGAVNIPSNPQNYTFTWYDDTNMEIGSGSSIAGLAAGQYWLEAVDPITGCAARESINIYDDDAGFAISSIDNVPDCDVDGAAVTLIGVMSYPVSYRVFNNRTAEEVINESRGTANGVPFQTSNLEPGDYTVEITADGCIQSEEVTIEPDIETEFDITINSLCRPNAEVVVVPLTGSGHTYSWTGPNGFSFDGGTINPTDAGDYIIEVDSDLCPNDSTITLDINSSPTVDIQPVGDECNGQLVLRAQPGQAGNYSYRWFNGQTGDRISFDAPGQYDNVSVTIANDAGCQGTAGPESYNVYDEIVVDVVSTIACQDGQPFTLTAESQTPGLTYSWTGPDVPSDANSETIEATVAGVYTVEGSVPFASCSGEAQISVAREPLTPSGLEPEHEYCAEDPNPDNQFVLLDPLNTFEEYEWFGPAGNLVSDFSTYEVSGGEEGEFIGRFRALNGCVTVDTIFVDNDCEPVVFAPNAFTPNGDGNNDAFRIFPLFISEFEIFIYSRWGELLFQSDSPDFQWDGTKNGVLLPTGTYPYVMRFRSLTDPGRGIIEKRGGVLLLR